MERLAMLLGVLFAYVRWLIVIPLKVGVYYQLNVKKTDTMVSRGRICFMR
ncbi:hypothetical protein SAMN05216311_12315 [Chitinophaga sp. CF418]|nr:hypothetical protein SAMN05216311_12315 [Chitinophaga sp. CF418]